MDTTGWELMDALQTALQARSGLEGVHVAQEDHRDWGSDESIVIAGFDVDQAFRGMRAGGLTTREDGTLRMSVYVQRDGASVEVATAVRARLQELLVEVATCLAQDPGVTDTVAWARPSALRFEQGIAPDHRWGEVQVDVSFRAHF